MGPLAHMLTGALVGLVTPSPSLGVAGGVLSHLLLDALPHAEAKTFRTSRGAPGVGNAKPASRITVAVPLRGPFRGGRNPHTPVLLTRTLGDEDLSLPDLVEAGFELLAGIAILMWYLTRCPGVRPLEVGLGALSGILPDLVDVPLKMLFGFAVLHVPALHWTVTRRNALWGILTQIAVAGGAMALLWVLGSCG
jgi:hypothetical protein